MSDNIVPGSNYAWKETTHVSRRATSYFLKSIVIILTVQRPAVSREFVFKIRRRVVTHNLMYINTYILLDSHYPNQHFHFHHFL